MTDRILIVDDDKSICEILRENLNEQGYDCAEAYEGVAGLVKLTKEHFDAVLLDIGMPGVSGMDVLAEIRLRHRDIAVIMITGSGEVGVAVKAMKLGANDFIMKPFDISTLLEKLCSAIDSVKSIVNCGDYFSEMDAIAFGVEERLESIDGHSKLVTETTANTARLLGIPEPKINSWISKRASQAESRNRSIMISFAKLQQSPLAQMLLGVATPYSCENNKDDNRN